MESFVKLKSVRKSVLANCILIGLMGTHAGAAESNWPVCVRSGKAPMYRQPARKSALSWVVGENMPLMATTQKGSWVKVIDLDGEHHWIEKKHLQYKSSCAVVKAGKAFLRVSPSQKARLAELSTVEKYSSFKKIDRDGAWVHVQDEFQGKYWVHENVLWIPVMRTRVTF